MRAQDTPNGHAIEKGINVRHAKSCPMQEKDGRRCTCSPAFEAQVWSRRDGKAIRRRFPKLSEAKAWRSEAHTAVRRGSMRAPTQLTLREAAEKWLAGARAGTVLPRGGRHPFKPSVIRSYEGALNYRVLPELGALKLSAIERRDVQAFAERMLVEGLNPSTVKNNLMPLRVIFREAVHDGIVTLNPVDGVRLPSSAGEGKPRRVVSPDVALAFIGELPEGDQAFWATAFLGGLRAGELLALRWEDVNGTVEVSRSWDREAGEVAPKSRAGTRKVPLSPTLVGYLDAHRALTGRDSGLVFGKTETVPPSMSTMRKRATTAWKRMNARRVERELEPVEQVTLHEARHTFASLMIEAGVNAKAIATYLGHSSIEVTFDIYGHLFEGREQEDAARLDALIGRYDTAVRLDQLA
jgi:integrase